MTEPAPGIAAVLWDLDGTLLDTEHLWLEAETSVMARYHRPWGSDDQRACLGGPLERVGRYMHGQIGEASPGADDLGQELLGEMEHLLRTRSPQWRPGAVELIAGVAAQGIPMALVTASHRRLLDAIDATLENALAEAAGTAAPVFAAVVAGDEVAHTKPAPDPYLEAAHRLDVDVTDCIVIEDSPTGVTAGLASGAFVIAVPHMSQIASNPRCHVVDSLVDVDVAALQRWSSTR